MSPGSSHRSPFQGRRGVYWPCTRKKVAVEVAGRVVVLVVKVPREDHWVVGRIGVAWRSKGAVPPVHWRRTLVVARWMVRRMASWTVIMTASKAGVWMPSSALSMRVYWPGVLKIAVVLV